LLTHAPSASICSIQTSQPFCAVLSLKGNSTLASTTSNLNHDDIRGSG